MSGAKQILWQDKEPSDKVNPDPPEKKVSHTDMNDIKIVTKDHAERIDSITEDVGDIQSSLSPVIGFAEFSGATLVSSGGVALVSAHRAGAGRYRFTFSGDIVVEIRRIMVSVSIKGSLSRSWRIDDGDASENRLDVMTFNQLGSLVDESFRVYFLLGPEWPT